MSIQTSNRVRCRLNLKKSKVIVKNVQDNSRTLTSSKMQNRKNVEGSKSRQKNRTVRLSLVIVKDNTVEDGTDSQRCFSLERKQHIQHSPKNVFFSFQRTMENVDRGNKPVRNKQAD